MDLLIKTFPTSIKLNSIFENKQTSTEISCGPDLTRMDVECRPRPPSKAFPMVVNGSLHALYIEVLDCARRQQGTSSLLTWPKYLLSHIENLGTQPVPVLVWALFSPRGVISIIKWLEVFWLLRLMQWSFRIPRTQSLRLLNNQQQTEANGWALNIANYQGGPEEGNLNPPYFLVELKLYLDPSPIFPMSIHSTL